jgi:hypothetical protein
MPPSAAPFNHAVTISPDRMYALSASDSGCTSCTCHYRKLRPDTRTSFDQLILAEAGVLIDSPSYHRGKPEARPGSSVPQKARPTGEKVCFGLEKLSTRRSRDEGTERTSHNVAKDRLSSALFVSMVQAAYLSNGNDTTILRSIHGSRLRGGGAICGPNSTQTPSDANGGLYPASGCAARAASPARNGTSKSTAGGPIAEGGDDVARFVAGRRSDGGGQRSQPAERRGSET